MSPEVRIFSPSLPGNIYSLYKDEGLAVFVYRKDSLYFWSDNSVPVPGLAAKISESTIDQIGNSVFLKKERMLPDEDSLAVYRSCAY